MDRLRNRSDRQPAQQITTTLFDGVLLERYVYAPGPPSAHVPHMHDSYQICLSLNLPGEYQYRGSRHAVPTGSLSVIQPGELHASRDAGPRRHTSIFQLLYVTPDQIAHITANTHDPRDGLPSFRDPIVLDRSLTRRFHHMHRVIEEGSTHLDQQTRLLLTLTTLVDRYGRRTAHELSFTRARPAVSRVRDYLHDHLAADVSLDQIASIASLSPYHLCRVFRREIGVPPHMYQTQIRIDRAKPLLAAGMPPAHVAVTLGFYDQSHFGQHFKRIVGTSPGAYARGAKSS